jgi:hypothetical protein
MGVISGYNKNNFISAELIYSKVKRDLKSFTGVNLIDDGDFPEYTAKVLDFLGIGALKECETISETTDRKIKLPDNFVELFAAYNCDENSSTDSNWVSQGKQQIKQDVTCELKGVNTNKCSVYCNSSERLINTITVEMFVNNTNTKRVFNIVPLRLSPNVKPICSEDCLNLISSNDWEITINDGYIYTNFDGCIYLKYYGFPLDDDGLPMVPRVLEIENAIEWYIKYQVLLNMWFNSDVPDIQNKWSKAEEQYNKWLNEARWKLKLPSFATLINQARNKRSQNLVTLFSKQYKR